MKMEIKTDNEKILLGFLSSLLTEQGLKKDMVNALEPWELFDHLLKNLHIARIMREKDKKEIRRLRRDLNFLKQKTFPFFGTGNPYN